MKGRIKGKEKRKKEEGEKKYFFIENRNSFVRLIDRIEGDEAIRLLDCACLAEDDASDFSIGDFLLNEF